MMNGPSKNSPAPAAKSPVEETGTSWKIATVVLVIIVISLAVAVAYFASGRNQSVTTDATNYQNSTTQCGPAVCDPTTLPIRVISTSSTASNVPASFYLTYLSTKQTFLAGETNTNSTYPVNTTISSAFLRLQTYPVYYDYSLGLQTGNSSINLPMISIPVQQHTSNSSRGLTYFNLNISKIFSYLQSFEIKQNITKSLVFDFNLTILALNPSAGINSTVYSMVVGQIYLNSPIGDYAAFIAFQYINVGVIPPEGFSE